MKARFVATLFQIVIEIGAIALAWIFFDWKLALIVFLITWARNIEVSTR